MCSKAFKVSGDPGSPIVSPSSLGTAVSYPDATQEFNIFPNPAHLEGSDPSTFDLE